MHNVDIWDVIKTFGSGAIGAIIMLVLGLGYHSRKHQELDALQQEHVLRGKSCPQVTPLVAKIDRLETKIDSVESKVDVIVGFIRGTNGSIGGIL